jgi:hypothetical protein
MSKGRPKSPFAPSVAPQARSRKATVQIPCFDFAELRSATLNTNGSGASG